MRYLVTLRDEVRDRDVLVLARILMDNHAHLLVKSAPESLSRMVQRVGVSYTMRFNGCHGHVGKVLQDVLVRSRQDGCLPQRG